MKDRTFILFVGVTIMAGIALWLIARKLPQAPNPDISPIPIPPPREPLPVPGQINL